MYKPSDPPLTRRGSLRSLRSAPLLSTVLESTLSLTRIHPIASLELPGLEYQFHAQSALATHRHRDLGTSWHSVAVTAASGAQQSGVGGTGTGPAPGGLIGRHPSIRHVEQKRNLQPKR